MTHEQKLERSFFAIEGVRSNPELVKALKQVGWEPKETANGWSQYQETSALFAAQKEKLSQQRRATDELHAAQDALNRMYQKHLHLARMAVPFQRNTYRTLELDGKRKSDRSAWLGQVRTFYNNLPLVQEELSSYGVTPEEIAQTRAMIDAVATARVKQNEARSATQQARVKRDRSYKELNAWTRRFIRTVRYAFADNPQQLEALGITVK